MRVGFRLMDVVSGARRDERGQALARGEIWIQTGVGVSPHKSAGWQPALRGYDRSLAMATAILRIRIWLA